MEASGVVSELHRWPVKSMAGQPVDALRVDGRGAAGARTHALLHEHKGQWRRLTAREAPRLLAWTATYTTGGETADPERPPVAELVSPQGERFGWEDPRLPAALADDLGRPVRLSRDLAGQQDLADSLLVTTQATLEAVAAELDAPLDLRRFRPNLHLVLDADAFAENDWEGRTLVVGDAELRLLHPCVRCAIPTRDPDTQEKWPGLLRHLNRTHDTLFGINARATGPATVRLGDRVELR